MSSIAAIGNEIHLPEGDTPGQIDAILKGLGKIEISITAFEAVYLVSALQLALSHPSMVDKSLLPNQRVEKIARDLSDGVARHPVLKKMLDEGWKRTEFIRELNEKVVASKQEEAAKAAAIELPTTVRELRQLGKKAGLKSLGKLKKDKLTELITELLPQQLIAAHEAWSADAKLR